MDDIDNSSVAALEMVMRSIFELHQQLEAECKAISAKRDTNEDLRAGYYYGLHRASVALAHLINITTMRQIRHELQSRDTGPEHDDSESSGDCPEHL